MGKSKGNFITLDELFGGSHPLLEQAYTPMTIRFFILQAHYRSTLDFSNEALQAAEKGLKKMLQAAKDAGGLKTSDAAERLQEPGNILERVVEALCDDMNTPGALSGLFDAVRLVNSLKEQDTALHPEDAATLKSLFKDILEGVLGISGESGNDASGNIISGLMAMILDIRKSAKEEKNWAVSDKIRDELGKIGIKVKDTKEGSEWSL